MPYRVGTKAFQTSRLCASADFAAVFAALDRIIAEGDREIARLEAVLAGLRARPSGETASVAEGDVRLGEVNERAAERRPDVITMFECDDRARRKKAA